MTYPSSLRKVHLEALGVLLFAEEDQNMKTLYISLVVVGLVLFRMLFISPAWALFPKSWQQWLMGRSYSPFFRTKSK
jgi:hypothetical protein